MSEFATIDIDEFMSVREPSDSLPISRLAGASNTTDAGNAERFAALHKDRFRYIAGVGKWLEWDASRWRVVSGQGVLIQAAKEVARDILREASEITVESRRTEIAKHALASENLRKMEAMIKVASSEAEFEVTVHELDAKPLLLAAPNGTIDLRTGELREPCRHDLLTRGTAVEYDASATAPRWEQFLDEVFAGRSDLVAFMHRAIGYSLTGRVDGQCLFLLHGRGANGKSVLLSVLLELLGDAGITAPFDTFVKKQSDGGVPNDLAMMRGARLVVASEGEDGAKLAESRIKQLTGGDEVSARFMHGEFFAFKPVLKLWLATNHKPSVRGTEEAIWRRMKLVPFDVSFADRPDPLLTEKLRAELPGILAWAVRGCQAWLADGGGKRGLDVSETVRAATELYRLDSDILGQFMAEVLEEREHASITTRDLYGAYTDWCEDSGRHKMTKQTLGRQLSERGFPSSVGAKSRRHKGLTLRGASHD
jgi:putative DNA primase/helicase